MTDFTIVPISKIYQYFQRFNFRKLRNLFMAQFYESCWSARKAGYKLMRFSLYNLIVHHTYQIFIIDGVSRSKHRLQTAPLVSVDSLQEETNSDASASKKRR